MTIVKTETIGYGKRIGNALVGLVFGLILLVGSCVLLFWNEGKAVKTMKSLKEGLSVFVSANADYVDPENQNTIHTADTVAK